MMRAPDAWSVAVRQKNGEIVARRDVLARLSERNRWAKVPWVRGIFVLGESLSLGFKALSWSAQKATDEEEEPLTSVQIGWTMVLAFTFFAGVFIILPALAAGAAASHSGLLFNLSEGLIRLTLFIGYIWAIGRSSEISRVFEYHGAEHMSIHAFEAGDPFERLLGRQLSAGTPTMWDKLPVDRGSGFDRFLLILWRPRIGIFGGFPSRRNPDHRWRRI